ncbi:hypothetical protein [Nocardia gipuzkoensis]|uniref:hypothetical protein n=1 Tax=Nocardia gipuzkoensis TaxID=2749991 RepID=UPI003EE061E9
MRFVRTFFVGLLAAITLLLGYAQASAVTRVFDTEEEFLAAVRDNGYCVQQLDPNKLDYLKWLGSTYR